MLEVKEQSVVNRRTKGEKTRRLILNATIEVLAKQGIKGTTHRAVAKQADLQLSLTTYYFKDIQELVYEAFVLNCVENHEKTENIWYQTFQLLQQYNKTSLRKASVKEEFCHKLSAISAQYLHHNIIQNSTQLAVEQLLFTVMHLNPKLSVIGKQHRETLLEPFIELCTFFNKNEPEIDADIMLTMFTQLEYRYLFTSEKELKIEELTKFTHRMICWVLGIKP